MDTVNIEAEPDENPQILENQIPEILIETFMTVKLFLEENGWFVLLGFIVLMYLFSWFRKRLSRWSKRREDKAYYDKYEGGKFQETFAAMQKAREKMQEENNRKTEKFIEQEREREEKKRQQRMDKLEGKSSILNLGSVSNDSKPKPKSKSSLRSDYLPLSGSGPSSTFRPSRRFTGGG